MLALRWLFTCLLLQAAALAIKRYMENDPDNVGFTLIALAPKQE